MQKKRQNAFDHLISKYSALDDDNNNNNNDKKKLL